MSLMRNVLLVACLFIGVLAPAGAQSRASTDDEKAAANKAYEAKDWAKAEPLYEHITQAQNDNFHSWYRLGVCRQALGERQKALEAFQRAQAKGMPMAVVGYKIAAVYASLGQSDQAFGQLAEAVKQGYSNPEQIRTDPDLRAIRSDARFPPLVEQAKHNQSPCDYKAENRQFDFWVGDWDVVTTKEGSSAGVSHIERVIGNCVIWENWTSLGDTGYMGKSYNIYNTDLKRWEQFWVDNVGGMIHFYGGLKDGVMDFCTDEMPQSDGTKLKRHLQFFNLGPYEVRQFSQGSTDSGKTWAVEYDFTYNRRK
jgi:tetratricopeptide (TPR) repeat protein